MAECLAAIHDHNVIHCDIKLANFLVRAHKASGKGIKFTTKVSAEQCLQGHLQMYIQAWYPTQHVF